jgi:hypothetical protein
MFGLRSRVRNMDSATSTDTRSDEELLDAARNGDEGALAVLVDRPRDRLERMVGRRLGRRLPGRVDPADVIQEAYLTSGATARAPGAPQRGCRRGGDGT